MCKKTILLFIVLLAANMLFINSSSAQQYSTDAMLIKNTGDKIATLKCSGVSDKKKTATEMAVKSAIYTYLYNGIDGINQGQPLLGRTPSDKAAAYVANLLNSGRYSVFVKGYLVDEEASKNFAKTYQTYITLDLYIESMYKDLLNSGMIGLNVNQTNLTTTQEEIAIPSIMVVPYCKQGEDYQQKMQSNPYIRMAMSKVNAGLINKGVETKDVEQMIRNADLQQARNADMSMNDMILANSGADVGVYVDISQNTNDYGTVVSLILSAVDAATGNTYATVSQDAPRKRAPVEVICGALAEVMIGDFLKQVEVGFAKKIFKGNTIAVSFVINPNSAVTFDSEIGNDYTPLSDAIFQWMRRNAKDGKFHSQGRTKTSIVLDEIQIANKNEFGEDMDVNDFSLTLYKYLRSQNLTIERNINGNRIEITIL